MGMFVRVAAVWTVASTGVGAFFFVVFLAGLRVVMR